MTRRDDPARSQLIGPSHEAEGAANDGRGSTAAEAGMKVASQDRDPPWIANGVASIGYEPRVTRLLPPRMPADKNPALRVRQELALWASPRMKEVQEVIEATALIDVTVLITGETGAGKELVARAVHYLGVRRAGPFVKVNCAAVARELLESELFGHERGAFTGAHELKVGKFEAADHGTIFLDEIGDLHPALQAKLLHVLEDGQFSRVGGRSTVKVDVRVVAASNQDLERAVARGDFREDLFYRLNVIRVIVPPLRKRPEDIALLARYFVERYSRLYHQEGFAMPPETLQRLMRHSFPGNVRELENTIKRMIVLRDPHLTRTPLPGLTANGDEPSAAKTVKAGSLRAMSRKAALAAERDMILKALEETHWNRLRAAKLLNISYRSLLYKIKDAGLNGKRHLPDGP
jgi:two-component system response regulator AtoC